MGQLITVTRKPTTRPNLVSFELNRSLTGMGHQRYRASVDIPGQTPADELARRLLAQPGVRSVHIYSNVVTAEVDGSVSTDELADIIRDLFTYYREGVEVADPLAAPAEAGETG